MKTKDLSLAAMIAAIYVAVSLVLAPITYGSLQVRIAEALTVLPLVFIPSIPGLIVGCLLTNLFGILLGFNPLGMMDLIFGTLATGLAAVCTYYLREQRIKGIPVLALAMPVVFNFVIVGFELAYVFMPNELMMGWLINGIYVAIGEVISVTLGYILLVLLQKKNILKL